jgi:ABC-type bacteriocin/lantibiotic exporter with double-glycine peptidase domain
MVLATFGIDLSEADLRQRCDCTSFGTEALKAVDALRELGFIRTAKWTFSVEELIAHVDVGLFPIVFVNLLPIDGLKVAHAMVVAQIDRKGVRVYDPLLGERVLPRSTFDAAWAMMRNLVILVQQ